MPSATDQEKTASVSLPLQGTLQKKSHHGQWRKKLFLLDSISLKVFVRAAQNQKTSDGSQKVTKQDELLLTNITNVALSLLEDDADNPDARKMFSFAVHKDGKVDQFELKAPTRQDAEKWVKAIKYAATSTPTAPEADKKQEEKKEKREDKKEDKKAIAWKLLAEDGWDQTSVACRVCHAEFGFFRRKHHCRKCGQCICGSCSEQSWSVPGLAPELSTDGKNGLRVCDECYLQLLDEERRINRGKEREQKRRQRSESRQTGDNALAHEDDDAVGEIHEGIRHMQSLRAKIPTWSYFANPLKKDLSRGELYLELTSALSLPAMDVGNSSDPYVIIELGEEKQQSTVKHSKLNPTWDEEFLFNVTNTTQIIKLSIFDFDSMSEDDLIGTVDIPLQDLSHQILVDGWYDIKLTPEVIEEQLKLFRANPKRLNLPSGRQRSKPRIHLRFHFTFNKWGDVMSHFDAVYPPIPPPPPFSLDDFYKGGTRLLWSILPALQSLAWIGYVLQWQSPFLSTIILVLMLACYNYSGLLPVLIQLKILHFMFGYYVHQTCTVATVSEQERALLTSKDTTDVKAELEKQEMKAKMEQDVSGSKEQKFNSLLASLVGSAVGSDWDEWLEWLQNLFSWLADWFEWIGAILTWADFISPVVFGIICFTTLYSCFFPFGDVAIVIGVFLMFVMTLPGQCFMWLFWGVLHWVNRPTWTKTELEEIRAKAQ